MAESGGRLRLRMSVLIGVAPCHFVSDCADANRVRILGLDEPWAERQMPIGQRAGGPGLSDTAMCFLAHCRDATAGPGRDPAMPARPGG